MLFECISVLYNCVFEVTNLTDFFFTLIGRI